MESLKNTSINIIEIKSCMLKKGVNVRTLSSKIGITDTSLYRKLRCQRDFSVDELKKIANELEVNVSIFFN